MKLKKKHVQNILKHEKSKENKNDPHSIPPTMMLTTCSHINEDFKKHPDEFPISFSKKLITFL